MPSPQTPQFYALPYPAFGLDMKIDPTKSALQNLLALVDAANPNGPTNAAQVTYTNLQAATLEGDAAANTSVELDGVSNQGFTGSQTFYYGRLALADEAASPTGSVNIPNGSTSDQILALVATYYGFIPAEISWQSVPVAPGTLPGDTTATVQCSGSLVYLDGTATVNLHWEA